MYNIHNTLSNMYNNHTIAENSCAEVIDMPLDPFC
jgi:hypothetical protein